MHYLVFGSLVTAALAFEERAVRTLAVDGIGSIGVGSLPEAPTIEDVPVQDITAVSSPDLATQISDADREKQANSYTVCIVMAFDSLLSSRSPKMTCKLMLRWTLSHPTRNTRSPLHQIRATLRRGR